jgi:hypothetical protein
MAVMALNRSPRRYRIRGPERMASISDCSGSVSGYEGEAQGSLRARPADLGESSVGERGLDDGIISL